MRIKTQFAISLFALISCQSDSLLTPMFNLPDSLGESSGLAIIPDADLIWTVEDSGNAAEIYALDRSGKIVRTVSIANVKNHDWEEISSDAAGNLYIGDIGNNDNKRKNLVIYKINAADLSKNTAQVSMTTTFNYPDQTDFPPKKSNRNFDSEAFFISNGNYYLFTKNRSVPFDGKTTLYEVPAMQGHFAARKISRFNTGNNYNYSAVTAADISRDGTKVALLTSSNVWLFTKFSGVDFFNGSAQKIDLNDYSQKEGMCFENEKTLLISDEKKKKNGGKVYELNLSTLERKP